MRRNVALLALLTFPTAAMAAGMPQLDFKNPLTISQVVWLVIIFVVFYWALARWALPQMGEVLQARTDAISRNLDAARLAKAGSDKATAELTAATREAQVAAQAQIAGALATANQAAIAQAAELQTRLEAQLAEAEQRITAAREAAMGALREAATDTASTLVSRLTGHAAPEGTVGAAVDAAMAARGRS